MEFPGLSSQNMHCLLGATKHVPTSGRLYACWRRTAGSKCEVWDLEPGVGWVGMRSSAGRQRWTKTGMSERQQQRGVKHRWRPKRGCMLDRDSLQHEGWKRKSQARCFPVSISHPLLVLLHIKHNHPPLLLFVTTASLALKLSVVDPRPCWWSASASHCGCMKETASFCFPQLQIIHIVLVQLG